MVFSFSIMLHSLTTELSHDYLASPGDGPGQFAAQIKIPPNAFPTDTVKPKKRFRVLEICLVLDAAVPRDAFGVKVLQVHFQGFQFRILARKAGGILDAPALKQAVFDTRVGLSGVRHKVKSN